MTESRHGGDIYADDWVSEPLDFSASINPLGMPEGVQEAAKQALAGCVHYPDPQCRKLRKAIAKRENVLENQVFCGNGAADVLYRLLFALKPKRILLPAPTFAEYEQAAKLAGSDIVRFSLQESDGFAVSAHFWDAVTPETDAVILCNPNNPTGQVMPRWLVKKGMERCAAVGAKLIVDECFHDFLDEPELVRMTGYVAEHTNLILLRSFTKMYAVPGIRLGYCLSSDATLLDRLYDMGAPWSVSVIAQACGIAAAQDVTFPVQTRKYIAAQRTYLQKGLQELGFTVIPGKANFLLCKNESAPDLVWKMRQEGILIRSCGNFAGLDDRWFRVAVRTEAENFVLLHTLRDIVRGEEQMEKQKNNPWESIHLTDYENHMSLDNVYQLQAMNQMMKEQFYTHPVKSAMILGVAGGNGLEHIDTHTFDKVYGVDINKNYLDTCKYRYPHLQDTFEPLCTDLMQDSAQLPHAELLIANLLIEYIGYASFQNTVKKVKPGYVSCIIQVNSDEEFVSDSPYLHVFDRLGEVLHEIGENGLTDAMLAIGYQKELQMETPLPNGKKLVRIDFSQNGV
ncbi:MAG: threonine-phosphate decarboxylase CobD [Clostridia bacterium]|nr:threonine-phosphate decarboxylase CobD [Clostridia bacterium]